MFIIVDWQNEDDITVLKNPKTLETSRFDRVEDATKALVEESSRTKNIYLNIIEI